jgi:hypothetical protein
MLDCHLDEMFHSSSREYSLLIHLTFDHNLLSIFLYLNGLRDFKTLVFIIYLRISYSLPPLPPPQS